MQALCDGGSGSRGALQCYNYSGCPGAVNNTNNCYPNELWSGSPTGEKYYWGNLNSGTFNYTNTGPIGQANSVRCVLDLNFLKQKEIRTLCDWNSGYGALRCNYHETGCKGAPSDDCYPNYVWSGTVQSGTTYYNRNLNGGTFNNNNLAYTYALTVRCVLDLKYIKTTCSPYGCPAFQLKY